jgi:hypothetical protein
LLRLKKNIAAWCGLDPKRSSTDYTFLNTYLSTGQATL